MDAATEADNHSTCFSLPDWPDPYLLTQVAGRSEHLDSGRQLTYDAAGLGEPVNVDAQAVIA